MGTTLVIDWPGLVGGVVLPIVVGLVTKQTTDPALKAVLLLLLTAVSGVVSQVIAAHEAGTAFNWGVALLTWGASWALAVATHFGLYKPTQISAWAGENLVK